MSDEEPKGKAFDVNDLPSLAGLSAQALTEGYLEEFLYDITVDFNGWFEQAPVLPRPLPSYIPFDDDHGKNNSDGAAAEKQYQFISLEKLMAEVEAAAPGCRMVPKKGHNVVVRRLSQLRLLYFKAREFSDIHYTLYLQKQATADTNSNIVTFVTVGVTIVLYFFGTKYQATVAFYSAIATIFVSTLNSWSTFKKFEEEANDHKAASAGFENIAGRIAATLDTAKSVSHVLNEEIKGLLILEAPSVRAKASPGIMRRLVHRVVPKIIRQKFSSSNKLLKTDLGMLKNHPLFEHFIKIKAIFELTFNLLDPETVTNQVWDKLSSAMNSDEPVRKSFKHLKLLQRQDFFESYALASGGASTDFGKQYPEYAEAARKSKIEIKDVKDEALTNAKGLEAIQKIFIGQLPQEVSRQFIVASKLLNALSDEDLKALQSLEGEWDEVQKKIFFFLVKKIGSEEEFMKVIADPMIKLYLYYVPGSLHKTLRVAADFGKNPDLRDLITSACKGVSQDDGGWLSKERVLECAVKYGLRLIEEKFKLQVCKYLHEQFIEGLLGGTQARVFNKDAVPAPDGGPPVNADLNKMLRVLCQVVTGPRVLLDLLDAPTNPQLIEWKVPPVEMGSKKLTLSEEQETKMDSLFNLWKGQKIIIGSESGSDDVEIRKIVDRGSIVLDEELQHDHTSCDDCRIISTTQFLNSLSVCKGKGEPLADLVLLARDLLRDMTQAILDKIDVGKLLENEGRIDRIDPKISLSDFKAVMSMEGIKDKLDECKKVVQGSNDGVDTINRRLYARNKPLWPISEYPDKESKRKNLLKSSEGAGQEDFLMYSPRAEDKKEFEKVKDEVEKLHASAQKEFLWRIESIAKSSCLEEASEKYGVNPVALYYLSKPKELVALLTSIKIADHVEDGDLHDHWQVKHYGLVEAIETSGIHNLVFQALKDRPETIISDRTKKKLANPTKFLELLLPHGEDKDRKAWVPVRDELLRLFPIMLKHVVPTSNGGGKWFEAASEKFNDPVDPTTFLRTIVRSFSDDEAVERMLKDLLDCLSHLLHRKLKSLLKFYVSVLMPKDEEEGRLAAIIAEKFREHRGNSAQAVSEVVSELFKELFSEEQNGGVFMRNLLRDMMPYLQEELSDRTIRLINLPDTIKQQINDLVSKGFVDELGEGGEDIQKLIDELINKTVEKSLPGVDKVGEYKGSLGKQLTTIQDIAMTSGDSDIKNSVRKIIMKCMRIKMQRISEGCLYDLRYLLRSIEPDVLYTIGGPLLPMMVEQFDHFAKSLQGVNLNTINDFIRDPRKALAKAESVLKKGAEDAVAGAAEGMTGAGGGDGDCTDDDHLTANEKLQVVLRRSLEYTAAHEMSGQQFQQQHLIFSFLTLMSATATSLLLFSSSNSENEDASSASNTNSTGATWGSLAANITAALTIFKDAANLSAQANRQYDTALAYLDLVHQIEYLLIKQTADDQEESLREISSRFYSIRHNSPSLPLPKLTDFFLKPLEPRKEKGDRDERLFRVISDDPLRLEKFAIMVFPDDRKGRKHPLQAPTRQFLRTAVDETGLADHVAKIFYYCCLPAQKLSRVMPMDADDVTEAIGDMRRASVAHVNSLPIYSEGTLGAEQEKPAAAGFKASYTKKKDKKRVIDPESKEKMRELDFLQVFDGIETDFSSAESTMPSVPYNLDAQYNFITWRARFKDAEKSFPLKRNSNYSDPLDPINVLPLEADSNLFDTTYVGKTRSERMLLMLHRFFCMSAEYCEVHYSLANKNKRIYTNLQLACLFLSTLITIILIYFGTDHEQTDKVVLVTGAMAALISAILSWSKFAQYDSLGASHEVAFAKFVAICSDVETLFIRLRRFTDKFENEAILVAMDECILEEEEESDDDSSSDEDSESGSDDDSSDDDSA